MLHVVENQLLSVIAIIDSGANISTNIATWVDFFGFETSSHGWHVEFAVSWYF